MASNLFAKAAAALQGVRNVDVIVPGSGYLDDGVHDVAIQAVDTSTLTDKRMTFTFVDAKGKTHRETPFLFQKGSENLSLDLRNILAATIPSTEAFAKFGEMLAADERAWEVLTGMKLRITLKRKNGFVLQATGGGTFAAFTVDDQGVVAKEPLEGTESENIADSKDAGLAMGLKRAYSKISAVEATHGDENLAAFLASKK